MHQQLDLYERAAPLVGLGLWERDLVNGGFYWNSVIRTILEVSADDHPGIEQSLQYYDDPEAMRRLIDLAIVSGEPQEGEFQLTTAKGNHKWVRVRVSADFDGTLCRTIYGTLEDISRQVALKLSLSEKEERFSAAFDHAPIGMALVAPGGSWIKVNNSLCKMLGYTPEEFIRHKFQDFTHPEDLDKDLQQMHQLLRGKISSYTMEKRYYHRDGHTIWAQLSVALVRSEEGVPLYFISQVKDISERVNHIETIRTQNERLLSFAHIISHNLRSHTGNMEMLTEMLASEKDPEEKEMLTGMLHKNSRNMLETLAHLNEVVRIQDAGDVGITSLSLLEQVQRVMDILAASLKSASALVRLDIPKELMIRFNPAYLESILINLFTNSLKYRHPERPPEISLKATIVSDQVRLDYMDNGLGMDLSKHGAQLFGMYKTFHKHPDARGMGLFLVKNHVEAMGGTIKAESQPGKSMTFSICIRNKFMG